MELPGRTVHAGVWFRLLRSLLDELSLAVTTVNQPARRTLEQVWDAAELPVRAGISVWAPYEQLPWQTQEKLLTAAAVAMALAARGRIIARGTLGPALAEPSHESVYAGDDPAQRPVSTWSSFTAAMDEWMCAARTTPGPAQQMLRMLTWYNTSPEKVVREREYLIRQGIPPKFLHLDPQPLWGRSVPADEAAVILVREGFEPFEVRQVIGEFLEELGLRLRRDDEDGPGGDGGNITEDDLGQLRARLSL